MTELHQEANSKEASPQEINNSETVEQIEKSDQTLVEKYSVGKVRFGLVLTVIGFILFLLGTRPDFFGADRSPVIGFVQIATFTIGLAFICVGGYSSLAGLWGKRELSLLADIGPRLVATGFVICVFSGMADVFGFGSHLLPDTVPYFGQWQAAGVQAGEFFIALGFLLLTPFHRFRRK
ncbi:MAG: hypothetical protein J7K85_08550 [Anaerolineaceae bacterium]|nr:hypothetical protein [Anaerolineaceae bacterium]